MARFTRTVSQSFNLLATAGRVDPRRPVRRSMASAAQESRPSQGTEVGRSDRRWLVFTGKKGGAEVAYGRKGKGTTIMLMVDREGIPLSAFTTAANTPEGQGIERLVDRSLWRRRPRHLLYDKAADWDQLRRRLGLRGIALVCPHRENRQRPPRQDGRVLRRYRRRYRVERTISWLQNCRRLITRWEYYADLFEGFVHLACLFTILALPLL